MTDDTWHLVKETPKVSGFLGSSGKPAPISDAEAQAILSQVQEGVDKPKRSVIYQVGETVKVVDGPFNGFDCTIEKVNEEKRKLEVMVKIFGRKTPLELSYMQVEKI